MNVEVILFFYFFCDNLIQFAQNIDSDGTVARAVEVVIDRRLHAQVLWLWACDSFANSLCCKLVFGFMDPVRRCKYSKWNAMRMRPNTLTLTEQCNLDRTCKASSCWITNKFVNLSVCIWNLRRLDASHTATRWSHAHSHTHNVRCRCHHWPRFAAQSQTGKQKRRKKFIHECHCEPLRR